MEQPTILLVDDEPNILKALQRLLVDEDLRILLASSGEKALALLAGGERPSIIISDQRMPGMTGSEFLAQAKEKLPDSVRIVLTGHADISCAIDAVNRGGIMRYITKPWNDGELRLVIREAMEKLELIRQNRELTSELQKKNKQLKLLNEELEKKVAARTRSLQRKMAELEARDRIQQHLLTCHPLVETLELVLKEITDISEMKATAVYLREKQGQAFRLAAALEIEDRAQQATASGLQEESVRKALLDGRPVVLKHPETSEGEDRFAGSTAAIPIEQGNELLGVIIAAKMAADPLNAEDVRVITSFGMQAAVAIRDSQLRETLPNLESSLDDLLHDFDT